MKIMVVCGMGCGTCHVLRVSVQKALNQLGIKAKVEISDVATASSSDADVWVALPEFASALRGRVGKNGRVIEVKTIINVDAIRETLEIGLRDEGSGESGPIDLAGPDRS